MAIDPLPKQYVEAAIFAKCQVSTGKGDPKDLEPKIRAYLKAAGVDEHALRLSYRHRQSPHAR